MKSEHKAYERDGEYWCKMCDHDGPGRCKVKNEKGYICTREPGHEGDHVACGALWPDPRHVHAVCGRGGGEVKP